MNQSISTSSSSSTSDTTSSSSSRPTLYPKPDINNFNNMMMNIHYEPVTIGDNGQRTKSNSFSAFEHNSPPTSPLINVARQLHMLKTNPSTPTHYTPTSSPIESPRTQPNQQHHHSNMLPLLPKISDNSNNAQSSSSGSPNPPHTPPHSRHNNNNNNRYSSTSVTNSPSYQSQRIHHPVAIHNQSPIEFATHSGQYNGGYPTGGGPGHGHGGHYHGQQHPQHGHHHHNHQLKRRSNSLDIYGPTDFEFASPGHAHFSSQPPVPTHHNHSRHPQQQHQQQQQHATLQFEGAKSRYESHKFQKEAILIAAYYNDLTGVKTLIEEGGHDMNHQCNVKKWTPLMLAAQCGGTEVVDYLLEQRNIQLDRQNNDGMTALFIASMSSNPDLVIKLLIKGANPNLANNEGTTPLMVASSIGNRDLVDTLVGFRATVNQVDKRGYSALMYAIIYGYKLNNDETHFNGKVVSGSMLHQKGSIIQLLLEHRSRIDTISSDEWSPLKLAIKHGPIDLVDYIVDKDNNLLMEPDSSGWNCLNLAIRYSPIEVIDLILEKGYPVNSRIEQLASLAMQAPNNNNQNNTNVPSVSPSSAAIMSPLALAIQFRNVDVVQRLIKYGLDIRQHGDPKQIVDFCREFNKPDIENFLTNYTIHQLRASDNQ
ncbi:hypothetical protein SAMD00019534_045290 [Acytostelium subglobosum LB1]|uniref:hypothetical protein n=1 Tax=Acytostelium subglobosum LB1 TaxID=1410327 RepID=UPI0006451539|nr:hypothetical protein SAMD00019534_045290 [Acytostelium subglobosum LB1]GAM21354.1 hypothetical protein SAMD00019534_045290 [Acytostelium subglobosum LB1]|eukprot:XP_012755473.1 hypothetical protein SAMD00019534_045290 [Acytostelium subglobosum LB1]